MPVSNNPIRSQNTFIKHWSVIPGKLEPFVFFSVPVLNLLKPWNIISICYTACRQLETPLIARFMGPKWGQPGADRTQVGPMLTPWTLLSGTSNEINRYKTSFYAFNFMPKSTLFVSPPEAFIYISEHKKIQSCQLVSNDMWLPPGVIGLSLNKVIEWSDLKYWRCGLESNVQKYA